MNSKGGDGRDGVSVGMGGGPNHHGETDRHPGLVQNPCYCNDLGHGHCSALGLHASALPKREPCPKPEKLSEPRSTSGMEARNVITLEVNAVDNQPEKAPD